MVKKIPFLLLVLVGVVFCQTGAMCFAETADTAALLERAEKYEDEDKYTEAEAIYKAIVQDYPSADYALTAQERLTILYINWEKETEAQAAYQELLTKYQGHKGIAKAVDDVANAYRDVKKYDKALEIYSYLVDTWGDSEQAMESQETVAKLYIELGDDPNAEAAVDKLIAGFADRDEIADAVDEMADEYKDAKKYDKALELYKYVVKTWADSEQAMGSQVSIATLYIELGDDPNAEAAVEKLIAEFADRDDIADVVDDVADEYRDIKNYEKALGLYKCVVDTWPENEKAMLSQVSIAKLNIKLGDETATEAAIGKLIADFSGNDDIAEAIGDIVKLYIRLGDDPNAEAAIDKLLTDFSADSDLPDALDDIEEVYEETGRYERAKEICRQIIKIDANSPRGIKAALDIPKLDIMSLIEVGNDGIAAAGVDKLIVDFDGHPDLPEALIRVGLKYEGKARVAKSKGDAQEANRCYQRAVAIYDTVIEQLPEREYSTAWAHWVAAVVYGQELGNYWRGIEYCRRIVENWPDYDYVCYAQYIIGRYYKRLRDSGELPKEEANVEIEAAWQAVIDNYPDCAWRKYAYYMLGRQKFEQGEYEEAAQYYLGFLGEYSGDELVDKVQSELERTAAAMMADEFLKGD